MLLKNIEEFLKKPLIVSRFLKKLDTSKKPHFWVVFGGTRKLHKINMHSFGGQKKYAKKYAFLEADPGEQKFQFYTVKCIFFAYFFKNSRFFQDLCKKYAFYGVKLRFLLPRVCLQKNIFFFGPLKNAYFFCVFFSCPPKPPKKMHIFLAPPKNVRFLAFAPIFFKNLQNVKDLLIFPMFFKTC